MLTSRRTPRFIAGMEKAIASDAGRPTPWMERLLRRVGRPLTRLLFRPVLHGTEHLPESGSFLLVANHSGGLGVAEIVAFASLYVTEVGTHRRLAGFAHWFAFHLWPVSALLRAIGAIPSTYAAAEAALAQGIPLLVFPGGDHETLRPIWQANRVDLGGRSGFLRIAKKANVPIVPMGIRGGHYTAPILLRSRVLAYLLILPRALWGGKRWAVSLLGMIGAGVIWALPAPWGVRLLLEWLWLGSPLILLPIIPWPIRFQIGAPIPPEKLFGPSGDAPLAEALRHVESELQALVNR